jgi:hypothetical protein
VSGEIKGIREGRDELRRQMKESGHSEAYIKKHVDGAVKRADQRIRDGKQPRPTYDGKPLNTKD